MKVAPGYKYHTFTVISKVVSEIKSYHTFWNVLCNCGKEHKVISSNITKNVKHKCDCWYLPIIEGEKIGEFTIMEQDNITSKKEFPKRRFLLCVRGHRFSQTENSLSNGKIPVCNKCKKLNKEKTITQSDNQIKPNTRYQHFTILSRDESSGGNGKHFKWNLICDCGREHSMQSGHIRMGRKKKCECTINSQDITGEYYGDIKVIGKAGCKITRDRKVNSQQFFYQCLNCGLIKIALGETIKRGDIKSCGNKGCRASGEQSKLYNPNAESRGNRDDGVSKALAKNTFARDNFKCVCCGQYGLRLEAHHLDAWHWCKEKRLDPYNLVTLCRGKLSGCHYEFHHIYGIKNNTREQFEEYMKQYHNKSLDDIFRKEDYHF